MRALLLLFVACKAPDPDTDPVGSDPIDTDVPEPPPGDTLLANLDSTAAIGVCDALEAVQAVSLACGTYDLDYGGALPNCDSVLPGIGTGCTLTVDDLLACAEQIPTATCDTDFSEEPCRALYAPACAPAGTVLSELLGGPYGLQGDLPLVALTDSQRYAFCLETTGFAPFTVDCNGEITIEPSTQPECTAQLAGLPATCTATLEDSRSCIDAVLAGSCAALFGGGPCEPLVDPSCQP